MMDTTGTSLKYVFVVSPFAKDHSEQSVRTQLGQQGQTFMQLVLRVPVVRYVMQAELCVFEAVELCVLVKEVQLVFNYIQGETVKYTSVLAFERCVSCKKRRRYLE